MRMPLNGPIVITSGYQKDRVNPVDKAKGKIVITDHLREDYRAAKGTPALAVMYGVVTQNAYNGAWGNQLIIAGTVHGHKIRAIYSHLDKTAVTVGDTVAEGEIIALTGATGKVTGPHLDFALEVDGKLVPPQEFIESHPTWDQEQEINNLMATGLINTKREPGQPVTWGELATILNRLKIPAIMNK